MSVFKANSKYVRDERGLAVPQAANDTFRSAQQKKKSASAQVISFDAGKREKFLSGFSKRRQARRKAGYLQQLEREREEKLELRREKRRELVDMVLQDRKKLFADALVPDDGIALASAASAASVTAVTAVTAAAVTVDDDDSGAAAASVDRQSSGSKKRRRTADAASADVDVLRFTDNTLTATVVVEPLSTLRNPVLEIDARINRSLLASKQNDERRKAQEEAKKKRKDAIQKRIATNLKRKAEKKKRARLNFK
jgi:hypothetical protein